MKGSRKNHLYSSSLILGFNGFRIYNKKYQKYQIRQRKKRKYEITAAKIEEERKKHIKASEGNKKEHYSKKILNNNTGAFCIHRRLFL